MEIDMRQIVFAKRYVDNLARNKWKYKKWELYTEGYYCLEFNLG